jgi:hypothetical protein
MAMVQAPSTPDEIEVGRERLYAALKARDAARSRYEACLGTSVELRAYTRLREAAARVAALERAGRR